MNGTTRWKVNGRIVERSKLLIWSENAYKYKEKKKKIKKKKNRREGER
jgi:hypothetical protein